MSQNVEQSGKIRIQKSGPNQSPEETTDYLEVPYFPTGTSPAYARFEIDYTRQIKQYEPIKIGISVSIPCAADDSEIRSTLKRAQDIATEKLGESKKSLDGLVKAGG